jgi:hypothetical protein
MEVSVAVIAMNLFHGSSAFYRFSSRPSSSIWLTENENEEGI